MMSRSTRYRRTGRILLITSLAALALSTLSTLAQAPILPRQYLDERRPLRGDTVRFCILREALTRDFDEELGRSLASYLLLEAEFYEVDPSAATPPLDYRLPLSAEDIYALLAEKCDAFMGFTLAPEGYPDWLTFTRPYWNSQFVLATRDHDFETLADIPRNMGIGTRLLSQGDIRFTLYLQSLPTDRRWRRVPYPDNRLLIERLLDGSVTAVLVWEPALYAASEGDVEGQGIKVIRTDPFRTPTVKFGIALPSQDSFLRTNLDQAIAAAIEDGVVQELLERNLVSRRPEAED